MGREGDIYGLKIHILHLCVYLKYMLDHYSFFIKTTNLIDNLEKCRRINELSDKEVHELHTFFTKQASEAYGGIALAQIRVDTFLGNPSPGYAKELEKTIFDGKYAKDLANELSVEECVDIAENILRERGWMQGEKVKQSVRKEIKEELEEIEKEKRKIEEERRKQKVWREIKPLAGIEKKLGKVKTPEKEIRKIPFRGKTGKEVREVEEILDKIKKVREKEDEEIRKREELEKHKAIPEDYGIEWIKKPEKKERKEVKEIKDKAIEMYKKRNIQYIIKWLNKLIEEGYISEEERKEIINSIYSKYGKPLDLEELTKQQPLEDEIIKIRHEIDDFLDKFFKTGGTRSDEIIKNTDWAKVHLMDALKSFEAGDIKSANKKFNEAKKEFETARKIWREKIEVAEPRKYKGKILTNDDWKRLETMIETLEKDPNITPEAKGRLQDARAKIDKSKYHLLQRGDAVESMKYFKEAEKEIEKARRLIWGKAAKEDLKKVGRGAKYAGAGALKLGSEEFKIPRAIAWGKRELDRRARKINDDFIKRDKREIKKKFEELKLKKLGSDVAKKRHEKEKAEKEFKELKKEMAAKKKWDQDKIDAFSKAVNIAEEEYKQALEEYKSRAKIYTDFKHSFERNLPNLQKAIRDEAGDVRDKACERYNIISSSGRADVLSSLELFADKIANELVSRDRTIYEGGAGWFGKVSEGGAAWGESLGFLMDNIKGAVIGILAGGIIGGLLGGAGGAVVGGIIGFMLGIDATRGIIEGFMFGPIVIGVILAYVMYLFTTAYVTSGIFGVGIGNLVLIFITIIFAVLLGLSETWGKKV